MQVARNTMYKIEINYSAIYLNFQDPFFLRLITAIPDK